MAQLLGKGTHNTGSADNIGGGQAVVSRFQATTTGTVDTLTFLTDAAYSSGTGLTSAFLGIFADSAGAVGALLGQNSVAGIPANPFVVTGLSVHVVSGTFYWIAALAQPAGANAGTFNFNDNTAGTANFGGVSVSTTMTSLSSATSWSLTATTAVPWAMFGSGTPDAVAFQPHRMPLGV
jgi:hypothetical protein